MIFFAILQIASAITVLAQDSNSVEIAVRHELFQQEIDDRTYTYLQYGRMLKQGDLFVRINTMFRGGETGNLYEIDFYPKFSERSYGYFNVGYSGFFMFPNLRTAAEYFRNVGKRWEFSLGVRTIHPDNYTIIAPTGTIGIYYGNWYTYFRPTLNLLEGGTSASFMLVNRRYFGDGKDYLELLLLKGEDRGAQRQFNAIENTFGLDTYVLRLRGVKKITNKYTVSIGADYAGLFIVERDEYIRITSFDATIKRFF